MSGLSIKSYNDIKIGDVIEGFEEVDEKTQANFHSCILFSELISSK